jgi:Plasmid pRiA4b ORF-3-like protein
MLRAEEAVLAAEMWASGLLGVMWAAGSADGWSAGSWVDAAGWVDPDEIMDSQLGELVDYLVSAGSPAALAALRALALVGEEEHRDRAAAGAEDLAGRGVPEPAWAGRADPPELVEAHSLGDLFGDIEVVLLAFQRSEGRHSLVAFLDHATGGGLAKIAFGQHEDGLVTELAESIRDELACTEPVRLTAAEVRVRLEDAVDRFLIYGSDFVGEPTPEVEEDDPTAAWALVRARVDSLPGLADPGLADSGDELTAEADPQERVIEAFLTSPYGAGLPDQEFARIWAAFAADAAVDAGRAPDQYGPVSLNFLLSGEAAEHLDIGDGDLDLLPAAVTAWAHFTADAHGLGEQAHRLWDEALPGLLADFTEEYAATEAAEHRATCPDVVAFRSYGAGLDPVLAAERLQTLFPPGPHPGREQALALAPPPLPAMGADATRAIHQLKIKLRNTRPPVWRRIEVPSTVTLAGLHDVIQASFGWDDDHLWEFDTPYGKHGPAADLGHRDPGAAALAQIAAEGTKLRYVFDFGDYWDHEIVVEKVVPAARTAAYPRCTGGRQPDPVQYGFDKDDFDLAGPFQREVVDARLAALRT